MTATPTITRNKDKGLIEFKCQNYTVPITMEGELPPNLEKYMIPVQFERKEGNALKTKLKFPIFIGRDGSPCLDIGRGHDGRLFFRLYASEKKYNQYGGGHSWIGSVLIKALVVEIWEGGTDDDHRTAYEHI